MTDFLVRPFGKQEGSQEPIRTLDSVICRNRVKIGNHWANPIFIYFHGKNRQLSFVTKWSSEPWESRQAPNSTEICWFQENSVKPCSVSASVATSFYHYHLLFSAGLIFHFHPPAAPLLPFLHPENGTTWVTPQLWEFQKPPSWGQICFWGGDWLRSQVSWTKVARLKCAACKSRPYLQESRRARADHAERKLLPNEIKSHAYRKCHVSKKTVQHCHWHRQSQQTIHYSPAILSNVCNRQGKIHLRNDLQTNK